MGMGSWNNRRWGVGLERCENGVDALSVRIADHVWSMRVLLWPHDSVGRMTNAYGDRSGIFRMAEKIKTKSGTTQGFEIIANREGLMRLAITCLRMAMEPEDNEQALQSGNHCHFAEWANNLEPDSDDFIVYKPDL